MSEIKYPNFVIYSDTDGNIIQGSCVISNITKTQYEVALTINNTKSITNSNITITVFKWWITEDPWQVVSLIANVSEKDKSISNGESKTFTQTCKLQINEPQTLSGCFTIEWNHNGYSKSYTSENILNIEIPVLNDTYTLEYNTTDLTNYYKFKTITQGLGKSIYINSEKPIRPGYAFGYWLGDDNKKYGPNQWVWLDKNLTLTPIWSQKFHYYKINSKGELEPKDCNIKIYHNGDWRDCNIHQYHDGSFN